MTPHWRQSRLNTTFCVLNITHDLFCCLMLVNILLILFLKRLQTGRFSALIRLSLSHLCTTQPAKTSASVYAFVQSIFVILDDQIVIVSTKMIKYGLVYQVWVPPEAGCPRLRPGRPATSWGHPDWWHGGCLPSERTDPAPGTARRDHRRDRSRSKPVCASEERV